MAQNVTDYFQVRAGVDLPAGMRVTECVSPYDGGRDSKPASVEADSMADRAAG
ncbi:MAG: hypothetical protein ABSD88_10580 [Candidatus Korobacteraceae bacterium]|jgi:hypothetical protein